MTTPSGSLPAHVDVLVVGAGISGIGAAYHLQTECPDRTYAIVEARDDIGGTWDLFRYPGVRSGTRRASGRSRRRSSGRGTWRPVHVPGRRTRP